MVTDFNEPYVWTDQGVKYDYEGISDEPSFTVQIIKDEQIVLKGNVRFSTLQNYVNQYAIPFTPQNQKTLQREPF